MESLTTLDLSDRQFLKVTANRIGPPLIFWRVVEMKPANRFSSRLRPHRTVKRETRADRWERLIDASPAIVVAAQISNVITDARRKWRREDRGE